MNSLILIIFLGFVAMIQARYAIIRESNIILPSNEKISKRSLPKKEETKEKIEEIYSGIEKSTEVPKKQALKKRSISDFYEDIDKWQYSIVHKQITKNRL